VGGGAEFVGVEAVNNKELAKRMLLAADDYQSDAELLASFPESSFIGGPVLDVLALEILLKCARLIEQGQRKTSQGSHNYRQIWNELSSNTQQDILARAAARAPSTLSALSVDALLEDWRRDFELARYPYDILRDETEEAIARRSTAWANKSGPLDEADFRFHPEELMTLRHGLKLWIEEQLK
jgi:hypothetical protein